MGSHDSGSIHTTQMKLVCPLVLVLVAALVSRNAEGQTAFPTLQSVLEVGQSVVITDDAGRESKGTVTDISTTSLAIRVPTTKDNPQGMRIFSSAAVAKVVRQDSLINGTLMGLGIGAAALWIDVAASCGPAGSDPECEAATAAHHLIPLVGGGTAIGALLDLAIQKTVYRLSSGSARPTLRMTPRVGSGGASLALAIGF